MRLRNAQRLTISLLTMTLFASVRAEAGLTPGSFSYTGNLVTGRWSHTSTLLANGKVLIVGGYTGSGENPMFVAQAELYNPQTGTFTSTGSLNLPRVGHTATLLDNGMVLVAGGKCKCTNGFPVSAEIYNPTTGTFTYTGNTNVPRGPGGTATLLNSGLVLMAGANPAELYNPTSGTFATTGNLNNPRSYHTASLLDDGTVLVAGGVVGFGSSATAELYNPSTGTFAGTGSLNYSRQMATANLLNNGSVLTVGGLNGGTVKAAELYVLNSQKFLLTGSSITGRPEGFTSTLLTNGTVLVVGGLRVTAAEELYDPSGGAFSATGSLNTSRWYHTATLLGNGLVLVVGGTSGAGSTASAELYDPTSLTPPGLVSISLSPNAPILAIGNSRSLVATGTISGSGPITLVSATWSSSNPTVATVTDDASNYGNIYALSSGTATISACAGSTCGSVVVTVVSHRSLLLGGAPGAGGTFEVYDDSGNRLNAGTLSIPRSLHSATMLLNDTVFVAGGTSDTTSWQVLDPSANVLSSGILQSSRFLHTATLLLNGNVFLGGGAGSPGDWEIHTPSGTLVAYGSFLQNRGSGASAVTLKNGNIWVSAGSLGSGSECSYEILDPTGKHVTNGDLDGCFAGGGVQVLNNGNVILFGGDNASGTYEIRSQSGSFVSTSSLLNGFNHGLNSAITANGNVFIFGSCQVGFAHPDPRDPNNTNSNPDDLSPGCTTSGAISTWEIRDGNGNYVSTGSLLDQRDGAGAAVLSNGNILITGGNLCGGCWEIRTSAGAFVAQGSLLNNDAGGHTLSHF